MDKLKECLPPREGGTYRIVDAPTNRFYVGSAVSLRARAKNHVYCLERGKHSNKIIQRIWNKDANRLLFAPVDIMPGAGRAERLAAEQKLLDAAAVKTNDLCMNMLAVAGSHEGAKRSAETCRKLSAALKGRTYSDATRARMRAAKLGVKQTPEHIANRNAAAAAARVGRPIKRRVGVSQHTLRSLTRDAVVALRALRASGLSWRDLAAKTNHKNQASVRRAILGITYSDVQMVAA